MESALVVQSPQSAVALHDVASVMFRHKRLLTTTFFSIVLLAVITALVLPSKYESNVKLLVQHERSDVVISPDRGEIRQAPSEEVSEADLQSEVELLKTDDILRNVVLQNGLAGRNPSPSKIDRAVVRLTDNLHIEPINKSNIIQITYRSTSPQKSAQVLNSLVALYMEKHLQIRRSNREYQFFDQQAAIYKQQLDDVEKKIAASGIVAPMLTRDQMVSKQADMTASAFQTDAEIAETQKRIASLESLEKTTPERLVTEKTAADNPQLLQNMKTALLSLEMERDQLLAKYQPSYRPVQDINKRIADTQALIAQQESEPVREEVTNQNTAFDWIRTELAKDQAELQGLEGKKTADSSILASNDQNLRNLNVDAIQQEDLQREAKTAEDNYLLYTQKREEARISDELDAKRIMNVVVVQAAMVPATHVHQRGKIVLFGLVAAILLSLAIALISDYFDPRFRSLRELAYSLEVPVLAAIPSGHELSRINPSAFRQENISEGRTA
jgi:uncharacterized protein involved in exopolysaccharide biosynthesis